MKRIAFILLFVSVALLGYSQTAALPPAYVPAVDSVAEQLVAMAIKNAPQIKSAQNIATSSNYLYKRSKTDWMENITARGNLNEYSIDQSNNATNNLYPRYNFGVVIPMGLFVNNPKKTKSDYYLYQSKLDDVNVEIKDMRRRVLTLYQDYLMNLKLKNIQLQIVNEYKVVIARYEDKFKEGQLSLEDFTTANMQYYNSITRQASVDRDLEVVKASLEALIGMNLDEAIYQIQAGKSKVN